MALDINRINPYIRLATESILPAGSVIRRRIIFDYELIYVESGSFLLTYADTEYSCRAGQFIFLRPGIPHSFSGIETDLSQPHIHFDMIHSPKSHITPICFLDFPQLTADQRGLLQEDLFAAYPQHPLVTFPDPARALRLFRRVIADKRRSLLSQKADFMHLLERLIDTNFPDCFAAQTGGYSIARQLKDFIDSRQGCHMSLADFEKQFSYCKYYLERRFGEEYGCSLMAYRNQKRLEWAAELLQERSVSDVAEELGFSSIYVFSRAFKKQFGCAPSNYKEKSK